MGDDRATDLSVALCTFEGERWLEPMLESLAAQSRLPDELVVADDGSSDGTLPLLRSFATSAPFPVSIEVNERRLGPTRNFERALERTTGRVIALADQDDVWHPEKLRRMGELMEEDLTTSLLFSDADLIDPAGHPIHPPRSLWSARGQARHLRTQPVVDATAIGRRPIATGCTMVVRRRAVAAALPFPEVLEDPAAPMGHDRWIALVATTVGTVLALDERHLAYRLHDDQATGLDHPARRAGRIATTAVDAVAGSREAFDRAHLALARQLEAASARGRRLGDHEEADALAELAEHHRARAAVGAASSGRTRAVIAEARTRRYGRDRAAASALAADLARSLHAGRPRTGPR